MERGAWGMFPVKPPPFSDAADTCEHEDIKVQDKKPAEHCETAGYMIPTITISR